MTTSTTAIPSGRAARAPLRASQLAPLEQGAKHLHKLVGRLGLVGVDPYVLEDRGALLRPVEDALGAGAVEGQAKPFRQEGGHGVADVILAPPRLSRGYEVGPSRLAVRVGGELGT
jgi:hypothetical protein